jgi:hypothetical protein
MTMYNLYCNAFLNPHRVFGEVIKGGHGRLLHILPPLYITIYIWVKRSH